MIGIDLKYTNNKVKKLRLYNNHDKILKFKFSDVKLFMIGNIFEDKSSILKKFKKNFKLKKYKDLLNLDGEYFFIVFDKSNNKLIFGNSNNSYIPIFYASEKKNLQISSNILNINHHYFKNVDFKQIAHWISFNGRSFGNKTFIKSIKVLEPGSICEYFNDEIKISSNSYFSYKNKKISLKKNILNITSSLRKAVNKRVKKTKGNISFGLSGGIDSRILLSLIEKDTLNKIKTHTIGDEMTYEKIIASQVSKIIKTKHSEITVPKSDYYKYAEKAFKNGSFSSVFKNGVKTKYYNIIKKKDQSKYFMFANALDVLIASSFSDKKLASIKNNKKFIAWYKKKYLLFNNREIKKLFNLNTKFFDKNINESMEKTISKINFNKDYINLNDSLTFETRIKRWHNFTLAQQSRISNFLIPTYDKFFLKHCSNIHSKYRSEDFFRRELLKFINPKLAEIETADAFTPAWVNKDVEEKFKFIILKLENLKKKLYINKNTKTPMPSKLYDTNLGLDIIFNKDFTIFFNKIKRINLNSKFKNILNYKFINTLIEDHKKNKKDNTRKIFMIISVIISLNLISKKNIN